jgi:3'-phosphoadenosine 5'-phosphosulfate sulfotransferase (PAPS reductase)/FAD synthetase
VEALVGVSHQILKDAVEDQVTNQKRTLSATAVLYSGGNDSTVLAHMFRSVVTHAVHANTGIGIEQTRQFVRDTCEGWGIPLLEYHPPAGSTFRELVLDQGFPGPAHHWKMYQRLKERCLDQARRELVGHSWRERVVFLAGRRRTESVRRTDIPVTDRKGSIVFVSPLVLWTAPDMNTYRLVQGDVPRNEVSDMIHMSGECLCGAFAHKNELDEVGEWFPAVKAEIEALEADVLATGKHPEWKCRWGWGADKAAIEKARKTMTDTEVAELFSRSKVGVMCSTCDAKPAGGSVVVS